MGEEGGEVAASGHVPGLDGLRGVAILSVVLFHLGVPGTSLGFGGVNLFFAISGFLITRILLETRDEPHFLRRFYTRRAARIFPIYYLYVLGCAAYDAFVLGADRPLHLGWYLTYTQTVPQVALQFQGGPHHTQHTWSLAVEEQFYAVWPFLVLVAGPRALRAATALAFVGALACRAVCFALSTNPFLVYDPIFVQMDSLAAGAALAIAVRSGVRAGTLRRASSLALVASGLALGTLVARHGLASYESIHVWAAVPENVVLLSVLAVLSFGLVSCVVAGSPRLVAVLEWRPLARVGRVSYGMYLYHLFVADFVSSTVFLALRFLVGERRVPAIWNGPGGCALRWSLVVLVTYLLAELSWWLVESRALAWKDRLAPPRPAATAPLA